MGFLVYRYQKAAGREEADIVRAFLECCEQHPDRAENTGDEMPRSTAPLIPDAACALDATSPEAPLPSDADLPGNLRYTYAIDFVFSGPGEGCLIRGADSVPAVKKLFKLIQSLETRAREAHLNRKLVFASAENLLAMLARTRQARRI